MRRVPGSARLSRTGLTTAAAALAVAVALPAAVPAQAVPAASHRAPSAADIKRATKHAATARVHLSTLRDRAEAAVEAYHEATVAAGAAHAVAVDKARLATQAADAARAAEDAARAAATASAAADGRAASARADLAAAEARVERAVEQFNIIAVDAYKSGGSMMQWSSVIDSADPMDFAQRQALVGQVGYYQQSVVTELATARADQAVATVAADRAAADARDAATAASDKAQLATAAAQRASEAATVATQADRAATAAERSAAAAKAAAARAVQAQLRRVHQLVANVAALERAAAEARRQARLAAERLAREQRAREAAARRAQDGGSSAQGGGGSAPAPSLGSGAGATAVRWAFKEIGIPYSWGGGDAAGPTYGVAQGTGILGFDCSGLTLFAYAHAGISLDHWTGSQWNAGPHVSRDALLPGDLLFFATDTGNPATIHHVAIYIGDGMMIEAPETGLVVRVAPAFRSDYIGAVRPWSNG
ncbi:MAG: NlpC/P60 family protein [Frankiaceae bacterium]